MVRLGNTVEEFIPEARGSEPREHIVEPFGWDRDGGLRGAVVVADEVAAGIQRTCDLLWPIADGHQESELVIRRAGTIACDYYFQHLTEAEDSRARQCGEFSQAEAR